MIGEELSLLTSQLNHYERAPPSSPYRAMVIQKATGPMLLPWQKSSTSLLLPFTEGESRYGRRRVHRTR